MFATAAPTTAPAATRPSNGPGAIRSPIFGSLSPTSSPTASMAVILAMSRSRRLPTRVLPMLSGLSARACATAAIPVMERAPVAPAIIAIGATKGVSVSMWSDRARTRPTAKAVRLSELHELSSATNCCLTHFARTIASSHPCRAVAVTCLESFVNSRLCLVMAAVGAAAACAPAHSENADLDKLSRGVVGTTAVTYYDVHGRTPGDVARSMQELGPEANGSFGHARASYSSTWHARNDGSGRCDLTSVQVTMVSQMMLPRWT